MKTCLRPFTILAFPFALGWAWALTFGLALGVATAADEPSYRFRESYGVPEDKKLGDSPTEHRISFTETLKIQIEKPQAAPEINEETQQITFRERPSQIDLHDEITAVVRRYESAKYGANAEKARSDPRMIEGLNIWIEPRANDLPRVLSLDKRRLRDVEYQRIGVHPFLPALATVLPVLPVRVGDTWRIGAGGVFALTYGRLDEEVDGLRGKLLEVQDGPKPGEKTAIMSVTGKAIGFWGGLLSVNARIHFRFAPPSSSPSPSPNAEPNPSNLINARGMIVKVLVGQTELLTGPPQAAQGTPLKRRDTRELVLNRQLIETPELTIPPSPPEPTVQNSWLLMVLGSEQEPFHLYYPQDYRPIPEPELSGVSLIRQRAGGPDILLLQPNAQNPISLDAKRTSRVNSWREGRRTATPGKTINLPAAEWPNREAKRFDAILDERNARDPDAPPTRVSFSGYVINFARKGGVYCEAMTAQKDPAAFRAEVERILKTFQMDLPASLKAGDAGSRKPTPNGSAPGE